MMTHIIAFILGGYLLPAVLFGWSVWDAEARAEDNPSMFERIISTIIGALTWPLSPIHSVTREEFDG